MTYELLGEPHVEAEYSDAWETVMVCPLRREDGATGDVWLVAGVRDYLRACSTAARTRHGYEGVRVFGNDLDHWCPEAFRDDLFAIMDVVDACQTAALRVHRAAMLALDDEPPAPCASCGATPCDCP